MTVAHCSCVMQYPRSLRANDQHVHLQIEYADCSQGWMKGGKVIEDLMPDYLHPSGPGTQSPAASAHPS